MDKDTRWRQRYENFDKAYRQFDTAIKDFEKLSVLEKEGLIQRFEYTFELAWKTLPYYFDIVHYDTLGHDGLREHIDTFSRNIYLKNF